MSEPHFVADTIGRSLELDGFANAAFVNWCRRVCQGAYTIRDNRWIEFAREDDLDSFLHSFPVSPGIET